MNAFPENDAEQTRPNIIFMVTDGTGPASFTAARQYYQTVNNLPMDFQFPLEKYFVGTSRTQSEFNLVTDSAAGATAFSCGKKTYNGAVAITSDEKPCGTILEALKLKGYKTGMIVTAPVQDATPASFAAHVPIRSMYDRISEYLIGDYVLGPVVDLLMGGGRCNFKECRIDGRNLFEEAVSKGYFVSENIESISKLPTIGLFANHYMDYEIDRTDQPSLSDMVKKALSIFERQPDPFFLLIEGSRIDIAAHQNDPATHIKELLAYHEMFKQVEKFIKQNPNTVFISTSDHETGGLTVGTKYALKPEYQWFPHVLSKVKHSTEYMANQLMYVPEVERKAFAEKIIVDWMGIENATDQEIDSLATSKSVQKAQSVMSVIQSIRASIGWTTNGHTGVDVNIYSNAALKGNIENTDIGKFMEKLTGVDLKEVTKILKKDYEPPFDSPVVENELHDLKVE